MPAPGQADVIEALYGAARDPQRWPEALSQIAGWTGAASAMLAMHDPLHRVTSAVASAGGRPFGGMADSGDVEHLAEQVLRRGVLRDVADPEGGTPPIVISVVPNTIGGGCGRYLALLLPPLSRNGRIGWISIAVASGRTAWREQASGKLVSLHRHMSRALDISLDLAVARRAGPSTITLLSAMPTAALLLEQEAGIIETNAAARAMLERGDGVYATPERRLHASLAREDQRLANAIAESLASGRSDRAQDGRQVIRIDRTGNGGSLLIVLDPAALEERRSLFDAPRNAVLVRLIDEDHTSDAISYPLHAAFDLTPAEARIAAAIGSGLSPSTIARRLDLSTNTVRSHLARIFDKTGTRSQHALTRLLAAIGSWPLA